MESKNKRIFISDLPETCTADELHGSFTKYGQVSSVEIKERKELGPNNKSLFFAYVNLVTDDKTLNRCFRDLSSTQWHGQRVQLQLARESFLERLKRERQEGDKPNSNFQPKNEEIILNEINTSNNFKPKTKKPISNKVNRLKSQQNKSSSESELDSSLSNEKIESKITNALGEEKLNIIIKNNKSKLLDKGGLKIPSVGKAPIVEITKTKNKTKQNDSEANIKRLQSLQNMKKSYVAQKALIKNALTYGGSKSNHKIIFKDDNWDNNDGEPDKVNGLKKNLLFNDGNSGDESDFEANFNVKKQFQGKSGQKLLELELKYKNDKRFTLDERFIEEEQDFDMKEEAEDSMEAEKTEQLKILEEVIGKKLTKSAPERESTSNKRMFKFDPTQPEHSSLELTVKEPNKKKKKEKIKQESEEDQKLEPEVSKEVFYKVSDKLKETFSEKPQFSLLSMFGRTEETKDDKQQIDTEKELKSLQQFGNKNPFKYDSSDDEDEIRDIPHKDTANNTSQTKTLEQPSSRTSMFWKEPFFFKNDDFRLQDGTDFVKKIKLEDKEFVQIRRELKGIVKAKVRNKERKNKMFKRKLGGNKKRKHIRIKKALKR